MRVLVTGATGFLGRHCLRRLAAEECEIDAVSHKPIAGRTPVEGAKPVRWHAADLSDPAAARQLIEALRPTHLLHLAWEATPRVYSQSPSNLRWLAAGLAMAEAFGEGGGERFVGAGSSAEYESGHNVCVEDTTPIRPATIYGKCKAACWQGLAAAAQHHKFSAAWGRIFLPYGPGDRPIRLVPSVLAAIAAREPVKTTHGGQMRDFIYAPDIADLLVRLLLAPEGGVFNIGTGRATMVRTVIEYLADRTGGRDLLRFGAVEPLPGEPPSLVADMSKVAATLGWSAPTSVEAGLDAVLAERTEFGMRE